MPKVESKAAISAYIAHENENTMPACTMAAPKSLGVEVDQVCKRIEQVYDLGKKLGRVMSGLVRECRHNVTGLKFACRSIYKQSPSYENIEDGRREFAILSKLKGHPNILSVEECFEDDGSLHIITELCEGGDLFERIASRGPLPEAKAANAFHALMEALRSCHTCGIVHRDVKPENVFLATCDDDFSRLKVADFGLAMYVSPGQKLYQMAGTTCYMAPEMLLGVGYDQKADMWSLGVVLYIMLSGYPPFYGDEEEEMIEAVKQGALDLKGFPWGAISADAKDLVGSLLRRDPRERASLDEAFGHPWIRNVFMKHRHSKLTCCRRQMDGDYRHRIHVLPPPRIPPACCNNL